MRSPERTPRTETARPKQAAQWETVGERVVASSSGDDGLCRLDSTLLTRPPMAVGTTKRPFLVPFPKTLLLEAVSPLNLYFYLAFSVSVISDQQRGVYTVFFELELCSTAGNSVKVIRKS